MEQIEKVALYFGGKEKMAKKFGVSLVAISHWKKCLPAGRAYQIEVFTKGKFKAKKLIKNLTKQGGRHG